MDYRDYQNARDAAWRILIDCHICDLPVKTSGLCKQLGIRLEQGAIQQDGYSTIVDGTPYIAVKEGLDAQRKRFTVAHEIGHIVLGHVGRYQLVNREPSQSDSPIERSANVFASRLLAPACVLWGCGVSSANDITRLCNISSQAALFRWERMRLLYGREKFLTSPLERGVYAQFRDFILSHHLQASSDPAWI